MAVAIVAHNDAADLPGCLRAVAALSHRPLEIAVVDSGSVDGSLTVARQGAPPGIPLQAIDLGGNLGFAAGMNAAIAATAAPFVLSLNADARPEPEYVTRLLARFAAHPEMAVGAVTGRLVRPSAASLPAEGASESKGGEARSAGLPPLRASGESEAADGAGRLLDACGMRLVQSWRHLDRGSGEVDRGQYGRPERVFGATGAASLFRRAALADAAIDGEVFDPRFHSFREDAELCFRLRERGWEVLYEPAAVAVHRRFNLPSRRREMPAHVNYHSLKNRYLLRFYHQTAGNFWRTLPATAARDLLALAYVLLRERPSLAAYGWLWQHRREIGQRRRQIAERRRMPIDRWFRLAGEPL